MRDSNRIPKAIADQLEELRGLEDRADRIEYLLAVAEEFQNPSPLEVARSPEARVPGCESEVYLATDAQDGTNTNFDFRFAVDNPQGISAMALAVILERGRHSPPTEICQLNDEMVFDVFGRELSMGKNLGLTNMVRMLKGRAGVLASPHPSGWNPPDSNS